MISLTKQLNGSILDIGGGGEGIIARLYGKQVTAIDNSQEELDEAPDGFEKVLMDATNLTYANASFEHVTCFYSLMFMSGQEQQLVLREAFRVLKNNGSLSIWDCNIPSAYPEPFCVDLDISLAEQHIHTTYGIIKLDTQSCESIMAFCTDAGFTLVECSNYNENFYLHLKKHKSI